MGGGAVALRVRHQPKGERHQHEDDSEEQGRPHVDPRGLTEIMSKTN
jgi:hypothetical protein